MLKGNKGEWSELYVLIALLAEGKLFQADENLQKDSENVYEVIKGYKFETDYNLEFTRGDEIVIKQMDNDIKFIGSYAITEFEKLACNLLAGIRNGKGSSFKIESLQNQLESLKFQKLKAPSSTKADINLRIYDHRLAKETDLGFSIKSLIGKKSTLFNPGAGTNFIYQFSNGEEFNLNDFNEITYKKSPKINSRIIGIEELGYDVSFEGVQSKQFWNNLKMIDGDLPDIMAFSLYYRYKYKVNKLKEVSELLESLDPLNFYDGEDSIQKMYEYKLKKFLTEAAMGMTADSPWLGEYDKFGGIIMAKNNGDILCFHIYDFNLVREYLINNTKFEQPATSEDKIYPGRLEENPSKPFRYGWLYEEEGKIMLKLNLQIRFC